MIRNGGAGRVKRWRELLAAERDAAIILAAAAMLGVGAGIGVLNGRSPVRSGLRQLLLGGAAALVTFGIGHLIGASVS